MKKQVKMRAKCACIWFSHVFNTAMGTPVGVLWTNIIEIILFVSMLQWLA
ncbi:MAG TPA: hypothetical protein VIJ27_14090 [Mucilaginibacter sp.]